MAILDKTNSYRIYYKKLKIHIYYLALQCWKIHWKMYNVQGKKGKNPLFLGLSSLTTPKKPPKNQKKYPQKPKNPTDNVTIIIYFKKLCKRKTDEPLGSLSWSIVGRNYSEAVMLINFLSAGFDCKEQT